MLFIKTRKHLNMMIHDHSNNIQTAVFNDSAVQGDTVSAEQNPERFKENLYSWNNLGVIHLIKGDDEAAYQYFPKAIDNGNAKAVHKMKGLNS